MKKATTILIMLALVLGTIGAVFAADEVSVQIADNLAIVTGAPQDSTLIAAYYQGGALSKVKLYRGSGTITADLSPDMEEADLMKLFLWDMERLRPLHTDVVVQDALPQVAIAVNGRTLLVTLEDNSSASALAALLRNAPLTLEMHDYGNFEKVASLGTTLPQNNESMTTQSGDLMLYQGNQITLYYDTNSWSLTRLGRVEGVTQQELKELLGAGNVTVTLSLHGVQQDANPGNFHFESASVMLNSGYEMPIMGMGTYGLSDEECYRSVTALLEAGGRLIDTAYMYHNEASVGRAVRDSGVPREEIFVITKLYPNQFSNPEAAIEAALETLDIGYIDMLLLHHPGAGDVAAYRAMEAAVKAGKVRSIGLSNWYVEELESFLPQVTIMPALVQNEIHPYYQENDVIPYIQSLGITVQGWYPLGGRGHTAELLGDATIKEIAEAHGVTSAQVILRWNLQKGVVVIPGSSNPDHIRENLDLFGFSLTDEEMARINALDRREKHDWY